MKRLTAFAIVTGTSGIAHTAAAQALGQGEEIGVAWWRVIAALLLCLALAAAGAFALRARLGVSTIRPPKLLQVLGSRSSATSRLRVIENQRIAPQATVSLITCDETSFLVACAPQGVAIVEVRPSGT